MLGHEHQPRRGTPLPLGISTTRRLPASLACKTPVSEHKNPRTAAAQDQLMPLPRVSVLELAPVGSVAVYSRGSVPMTLQQAQQQRREKLSMRRPTAARMLRPTCADSEHAALLFDDRSALLRCIVVLQHQAALAARCLSQNCTWG